MSESLAVQLRRFLVETNAMSLALGVVIGGAVTKLVGTMVSGLIMPVVTVALPGGDWRAWSVPLGTQRLALGEVIGATVDFLIISVVVFVVAAKIFRVEVKK